MERRHQIRNREANLAQDGQGKITKQELPVLFLPPVVGDGSSQFFDYGYNEEAEQPAREL